MKRFLYPLTASVLGMALITATAVGGPGNGSGPPARPAPSPMPRPMAPTQPTPKPAPIVQPIAKPTPKPASPLPSAPKPASEVKPAPKPITKEPLAPKPVPEVKATPKPVTPPVPITTKPANDQKAASAKSSSGMSKGAHDDFLKQQGGMTANQPREVQRPDKDKTKPIAPMNRGVDQRSNYHKECGYVFPKGHSCEGCYYYRGWDHCQWTSYKYEQTYGCNVYWCPWTKCYYYWCAPDYCYYPVDYVPYGKYTVEPVDPNVTAPGFGTLPVGNLGGGGGVPVGPPVVTGSQGSQAPNGPPLNDPVLQNVVGPPKKK